MLTRVALFANLALFALVGFDNWLARRGARRVSEMQLLVPGFLGCAPGLWLGMLFFRHKTSKPSFYLPALLAVATSGVAYYVAWYRT